MRTWKLPLRPWKVALLALVVISAATAATVIYQRSVRRLSDKAGKPGRGQAAALFVGVQRFSTEPAVPEVRHAVDDAVDLAYAFAMEKSRLVAPARVVLALSGEPKKDESKARLEKLREAGATVTAATQEDVLAQLQRQVEVAGSNGTLILSFASHGFSHEGTPYILTSTSRFEHETSLSAMKVLDLAAETKNSLIFIDACRERLDAGSRSATPASPGRTPAPLLSPKSRHGGQVVFYAAAPGAYAYDDSVVGNGVFTNAVLEGLNCKAETKKGQVTVGALAEYVEKDVLRWVRRNRDPNATRGIQAAIDHRAIDLPLANCLRPPEPASVTVKGDVLTVLDRDLRTLWVKTVPGLSTTPELADLDGDDLAEVVAGDDRGQIHVFDAAGNTKWPAPTNVPANYDHCDTGTMRVSLLRIGHLFSVKRGRQIVAVFEKGDGCSRLTAYDHDGTPIGSYWNPGKILDTRIDRPNARRAPRIIVTAVNRDLAKAPVAVREAVGTVFLLDPKNISGEAPPHLGRLGKGQQVWYGYVPERIEGLEIRDRNNDALRDIHVRTTHGYVCLDFEGKTIESRNVHFTMLAGK